MNSRTRIIALSLVAVVALASIYWQRNVLTDKTESAARDLIGSDAIDKPIAAESVLIAGNARKESPIVSGSNGRAAIDRLRLASSLSEAADLGLYTLNARDFWEATRDHNLAEIRSEACMLQGCLSQALSVKHKMETDATRSLFGSSAAIEYMAQYCSGLVDEASAAQFALNYGTFLESTCNPERSATEISRIATREDVGVNEIAEVLSSSSNLTELIAYTAVAIHFERGISGLDFRETKDPRISGGSGLFVPLLALKFGCRIKGYCAPGSPVFAQLCAGILVCRPGDNLEIIAQRNLTPLQFEAWRMAQLERPPG